LLTFGRRVSSLPEGIPVAPVNSSFKSRGRRSLVAFSASAIVLNGGDVSLFDSGPPALSGGSTEYGPFLVGAIIYVEGDVFVA
jgi:hypothetical protein